MTRAELLNAPEYWMVQIQTEIYRCAEEFMRNHHMNRTQFAQYLGVSKGYVTQLLNGDYNYSLEKLVELSLKMGMVPKVEFENIGTTIQLDTNFSKVQYISLGTYTKSSPSTDSAKSIA